MKNKDLEFKGTKGNWETNLKRYEFSKGYNAIEIQVQTNEKHYLGKWVAQVNSVIKEDFEEDKANAQLIAAAPELLEALVNLLKQTPDELRKDWLWGECDAAQKAINKALGHED